ncbi:MAG: hypothetical protein H6Q69_940 [Firmicutes bacterium]|nr:hypothetical protein [Bacillota bacterium]
MIDQMADLSQRKAAIVAGAAFLLMAIAAMFAYGFVLGNLIVPEDASATANKIIASMMLFRFSICSFLIVLICDVVVAWALYVFLKQVSKSLSLLTAWLRLVYATILGISLLNLVIVKLLLSGADYLTVFNTDQLYAQVLLFLNAFNIEWAIGLVVFGFHLFLLGCLVFKSGYIPRILGVLLIIGSLGYLITSFANLLLPNYENYKATIELVLSVPMAIGELSFAFWLLFKGGKTVS